MLRAIATLVALSLMLSACGGSSSETERARAVVQRYRAALAANDATEMCSLLTGEAQREVATLAAALTAAPKAKKVQGCVGFSRLFTANAASGRDGMASIRNTSVGAARVTGDSATVAIREADGTAREVMLERTQAGWRISLPSPAATGSFDLRGGPAAVTIEPPAAVAHDGEQLAQFYRGRTVVAQSGCLACHRIGDAGNAGPGPELTHVGSRLPPAAIERSLTNPTAPMPSFRRMPKAKLHALVTFLSLLRE